MPPTRSTAPPSTVLSSISAGSKSSVGGELVYVLAAGATGANKDLFDLVLVDRETVGDRYH